MAENNFKCGNCLYYQPHQIMGICRLYPSQQNKHELDWCGQHRAKGVEISALPVYDIVTDTFTAPPNSGEVKVKRKYTRRQNVDPTA